MQLTDEELRDVLARAEEIDRVARRLRLAHAGALDVLGDRLRRCRAARQIERWLGIREDISGVGRLARPGQSRLKSLSSAGPRDPWSRRRCGRADRLDHHDLAASLSARVFVA